MGLLLDCTVVLRYSDSAFASGMQGFGANAVTRHSRCGEVTGLGLLFFGQLTGQVLTAVTGLPILGVFYAMRRVALRERATLSTLV